MKEQYLTSIGEYIGGIKGEYFRVKAVANKTDERKVLKLLGWTKIAKTAKNIMNLSGALKSVERFDKCLLCFHREAINKALQKSNTNIRLLYSRKIVKSSGWQDDKIGFFKIKKLKKFENIITPKNIDNITTVLTANFLIIGKPDKSSFNLDNSLLPNGTYGLVLEDTIKNLQKQLKLKTTGKVDSDLIKIYKEKMGMDLSRIKYLTVTKIKNSNNSALIIGLPE